jgi:hypothetical protein
MDAAFKLHVVTDSQSQLPAAGGVCTYERPELDRAAMHFLFRGCPVDFVRPVVEVVLLLSVKLKKQPG